MTHKSNPEIVQFSNLSSGSKLLHVPKCRQNGIYIKAAITHHNPTSKERIRRYMKENNVDITHLNAIKSSFLSCRLAGNGIVHKNELF